jgi:very-short-patch-repair endonuclease
MMTETAAQQNLTNLLRYAEEILKISERTISDLAKDSFLTIHEGDVLGLEGVTIGPDDGFWVRFARLREIPAPTNDPIFDDWILKPPASRIFEKPQLADNRLTKITIEAASDLVEAGLTNMEDVMASLGDATTDHVDVLLRLANLPEFAAAFSAYVDGPWLTWAAKEQPRRRAIGLYNRLYTVHQRMIALGDDVPEECVFGVGMARWLHPLGRINVPLVEAAVELMLDPADGSIRVTPRPQPPKLCLRAFDKLEIGAVGRLERDGAEQLARSFNDPDIGFSPFEKLCFDAVLRMCCARLSASSIYEPDVRENLEDRSPPAADDKLRIGDAWVIYVRQRSIDFRCEDIRKLIHRVQEAPDDGSLPAPAVQITTAAVDVAIDVDVFDPAGNLILPTAPLAIGAPQALGGAFGAGGVSDGGGSPQAARPVFFPLAFNDEQQAIIRRLEDPSSSGVVVQGPPGTGKTHTIANIICHYMATGRRVLVTARTPEALAAIQEKLPPEIRDLAIAVIHSDRQGGQQLEQAIEMLSSQVKQIDMADYRQNCIDKERRLAEVRKEVSETDRLIFEYATLNLAPVSYRGEDYLPMELSAKIEAERPVHAWFPDELAIGAACKPQFTDADIAEARRVRGVLGADIIYDSNQLPDVARLPDTPRVLAAHQVLVHERDMEARAATGDLPTPSFSEQAGIEQAGSLLIWIESFGTWCDDVAQSEAWLPDLYRLLLGATPSDAAVQAGLRQLCGEWADLVREGSGYVLRGIEVSGVVPGDAPFDAAINALANGRKPFGLLAIGKSKQKAAIEGVRIEGHVPADAREWRIIQGYRLWQKRVHGFIGRWSSAARALRLPQLSGEWESGSQEFLRIGRLVERLYGFHLEAEERITLIIALFPYGVDAKRVVYHGEIAIVREALAATVQRGDHTAAHALKRSLDVISCDSALAFWAAFDEVRSAIGNPDVTPRALADSWRLLLDEARRLDGLRAARVRLTTLASAVRASGAPEWAAKLVREAADGKDRWTPGDWKQAWEWACAAGHLRNVSDRSHAAALSARYTALEDEQRRLLGEVIRLRTFMGLRRGITTTIATALTKFAMSVRRLGAGTGKAAERHRRAIREAAMEAAGAVPCWILPEWRVAEQLPSELAIFHLVIIDEASQSDITALPAVMRGQKLLIVGDDRQVSPISVGMEERTVIQLRETFLRGMPIANYLDPATSMYDIASMMFPGTTVMLREHFRCVEPIIRFSMRLCYKNNGGLLPLRVPTVAERLDPPLIDVYVRHGQKRRDINDAEADFIVTEIKRLADDPTYARRTIGVISLIGDKQAKRINDLLSVELGLEVMEKHRIVCGNASTFQGQERDIMFLSMVACPTTVRSQTTRMIEQRFNVAMSRARDRVYLVRSVTSSMLSPRDLKATILEHFRNPMGDAPVPRSADVLDQCDSPFEREVGARLLELGYRLRPQVRVGSYRIDFVIEDTEDHRLAVELDGDSYHGPDKWVSDLYRQRALERMGWRFWRCWGSHWRADPNGCFQDLLTTLARMHINPVGGEFSPIVCTEHRVLDKAEAAGTEPAAVVDEETDSVHAVGPDVELPQSTPAPSSIETVDAAAGALGLPLFANTAAVTTMPIAVADTEPELVIEPGDTVIVRFDDNRIRRFRLSTDTDRPEDGVVHIDQPIGAALLGCGLEEEVEFIVDGKARVVVIEKISKTAVLELAD